MLKRIMKNIRNNAKLGNALALGLALSVAMGSSAFALNYSGNGSGTGNKPISFCGYEFVNTTQIALYFDKRSDSGGQFDKTQFTVKTHTGGTADTVNSITTTTGKGTTGQYTDISDTAIQGGTKVLLNLATGLSDNTLYDVTINGSVMDKNGITAGNYAHGKDLTFTFEAPNSLTGSYTGNPYVTYIVGDPSNTTDVSYESNMIAVFDRPMSSGTAATYAGNITFTDSGTAVAGNEAWAAVYNNASTSAYNTFYFPETKDGNTLTVYNRTSGTHSYSLTLPTSFTDKNGTVTTALTGGGSSFSFSTAASDYAGWENPGNTTPLPNISATAGTGSITVSWPVNQTYSITPAPASFDIYYIINDGTNASKYASKSSWTLAANQAYSATSPNTYTISGLSNTHSYWVRVVPKNSAGIASGFSVDQGTATTPL
jgi:hypothetical protein